MENKRNYQKELDRLIENVKAQSIRPRIFLHSCCGPCSSYVLEYLTQYFDVTLFFFNPNIHPKEEYEKRLSEQYKVIERMKLDVSVVEGDYNPEDFFAAVKGLENEPEGGKRCEACIKMRMEETKKAAKAYGADFFATTLTVSPHKNALFINTCGEELADDKLCYLVSDFKKKNGYKRSIELSREHDIYRQEYCGCVYSFR